MKIGSKREHRFLHPAQIHRDHHQHHGEASRILNGNPSNRQETENRVGPAGDRDRNRQHVVDDQRASGNQSGLLAREFGRDQISAAAGGKLIDGLEYDAEMMKTVSAISSARKTARY